MSDELDPLSFRYQKALAPLAGLSEDASVGKRLSELLTLLDFSTTLNRSLELTEILDLVLLVAIGETRASWASIALRGEDGFLRFLAKRGASAPGSTATSFRAEGAESLERAVGPEDEELESNCRELLTALDADLVAPLRKAGRLIGLLILGKRPGGYGPGERSFVDALSISASASIDNGRVYEELQHLNRRLTLKVYQLNSLFDITRELHIALDASRVREVLIASAMGQPLATRCALVRPRGAVDARGVKLDPAQLDLLRSEAPKLDTKEEGVEMVKDLEPGPLRELLEGSGFEVALPLRSGDRSHGVLLVGHKANGQPFGEEDVDFLASLGAQGAAALDRLRLTREWVEKQKMEKEMAVARQIQRGLLPERDPSLEGWDIAGVNIPCLTVGGDYYDYMESSGGKLGLTIADVSGKGTGPALLMASVQASLGALAGLGDLPLDILFSRLNAMVFRSTEPSKYVTVFYGLLDTDSGELSYVNAGHVYPLLLRRDGAVVALSQGSTVVGLLPEVQVEIGTTHLETGDVLVLYTDGLSETRSPAGEEFEQERIVELARAAADLPAREVVGRLVSAARVFAAEAGLSDDVTLVIVKRL
jgi:sigma-B regulation protein RsbU (phosphoserine phosphatase)